MLSSCKDQIMQPITQFKRPFILCFYFLVSAIHHRLKEKQRKELKKSNCGQFNLFIVPFLSSEEARRRTEISHVSLVSERSFISRSFNDWIYKNIWSSLMKLMLSFLSPTVFAFGIEIKPRNHAQQFD